MRGCVIGHEAEELHTFSVMVTTTATWVSWPPSAMIEMEYDTYIDDARTVFRW